MISFSVLIIQTLCEGQVIGIDLGTTFSCVGVVQKGKVEIIANEIGARTTPSIVAFDDSKRYIGESASQFLLTHPENSVYAIKRLIGRRYSDDEIQSEIPHLPYKIVDVENRPFVELTAKGEKQLFSPEEISSMILSKMKNIAQDYIGENITDVVVTVPAYFNDGQRSATRDACRIAGLNPRRILNEPTAAAIAYGFDKRTNQKILVYDLGGGTFDVSLLSVEDSFFEVLSTAGDTHLGGEDFDNRLVEHFADIFERRTGMDPHLSKTSMARLKKECERAKRQLSSDLQSTLEISDFYNNTDFKETLTRARFDEINSDLLRKTLEPIEQVLKDAGVSKHDVDEIILVGGSTRIPRVRELVQEFFSGRRPNTAIDPDEAVAYGAAVAAGVLGGALLDDDVVIVNVNSLTLGIETIGGMMSELIPRNTKIPVKKTRVFSTAEDDDDTVTIQVYEGERSMTRDNHFLGSFDLTGLPPGPRGSVLFYVTFELDQNNILTVTAEDRTSGTAESLTIDAAQDRLSPAEIKEAIESAAEWAEDDAKVRAGVVARNNLLADVSKARRTIADGGVPEDVISVVEEIGKWAETNAAEDASAYEAKDEELRSVGFQLFGKEDEKDVQEVFDEV